MSSQGVFLHQCEVISVWDLNLHLHAVISDYVTMLTLKRKIKQRYLMTKVMIHVIA